MFTMQPRPPRSRQSRAVQVRVDHRAPALVGDLERVLRELAARIVHEHVEPAPGLRDAREERVDLLGLANVGWHREALGPDAREQRTGLLERLRAPPADRDARAEAAEEQRNRAPDPRAAARDEHAAAGKEARSEDRRQREQLLVAVDAPPLHRSTAHSRSTP
jgi:hypothetical protein